MVPRTAVDAGGEPPELADAPPHAPASDRDVLFAAARSRFFWTVVGATLLVGLTTGWTMSQQRMTHAGAPERPASHQLRAAVAHPDPAHPGAARHAEGVVVR